MNWVCSSELSTFIQHDLEERLPNNAVCYTGFLFLEDLNNQETTTKSYFHSIAR